VLNFRTVSSEHCQLTTWIDGIDRDFLFGNVHSTRAHPGLQPLPLVIGWGRNPPTAGTSGKRLLSPSKCLFVEGVTPCHMIFYSVTSLFDVTFSLFQKVT